MQEINDLQKAALIGVARYLETDPAELIKKKLKKEVAVDELSYEEAVEVIRFYNEVGLFVRKFRKLTPEEIVDGYIRQYEKIMEQIHDFINNTNNKPFLDDAEHDLDKCEECIALLNKIKEKLKKC